MAPTAIPQTLEDLRGKTPAELQQNIEVLDAHLRSLHQTDSGELRELDDAEQRAFDIGLEIREKAMAMLEEHRRISEVFKRRPQAVQSVYTAINTGLDDTGRGVVRLTPAEAREQALRVLENRTATAHLSASQKEMVERATRKDHLVARRIVVTENESYRSAWQKLVTNPYPILTDDERHAVLAWEEFRAMAEGGPTTGGYGQEEAA